MHHHNCHHYHYWLVLYFVPIEPSDPRALSITRILEEEIELNWLPPTEPNGEVHYVIYYTPEGGTERSLNTWKNLTHYNLTGLERNRVYTNIAVQAVNSAGWSDRSAVIAQYNHTPPGESWMHAYFQGMKCIMNGDRACYVDTVQVAKYHRNIM